MQLTDEQRQTVLDNLGLAHFAANRFISFNADYDFDREEVISASYYDLILAVLGYDDEHGETFGTYAVKSIRRQLYREFMYRYKTKPETDSLEDIALDIDGDNSNWESFLGSESPENDLVNRISVEQLIEKAESNTVKKILILRYCYPDTPQTEIGKLAGCSQRYVGMVLQDLKSARAKYY